MKENYLYGASYAGGASSANPTVGTATPARPATLEQLVSNLDWSDPLLKGTHRINFYDAAGKQTYSACRPMVELKLTQEEAQVIADICNSIGGHPERSRRGLVSEVARKLHARNVHGRLRSTCKDNIGHIYFSDAQ